MNLYIEVNTFLILSVIGAFIYEDLPTSLYDTIEWTLVVLIYMIVMVPTLVNIVLLIHNIIMKIRRHNREKMTGNQGKDIEANNQNI
jgi:cellulose synthase/poly-beta-1,6-N-acetylglucosamine synthase-like glycosyltransferase